MPQKGFITVDNECNISAYLSNGTYSINKNKDDDRFNEIESEVIDKIMNSYENGTPVYFNPTVGSMCTEDEVITAVGTIDGCMRWYIFNDDVGEDKVDMILEHNIYKQAAYSNSFTKLEQLNWVKGLNQRMLSLDELNKIIGSDTLKKIGEDGYSIYAWLYNYTTNNVGTACTELGCKYYGENSSKYWLNTKTENYDTTTRVYAVGAGAIVSRVDRDGGVGLRPVFSFNNTSSNDIYTLNKHDTLPISTF